MSFLPQIIYILLSVMGFVFFIHHWKTNKKIFVKETSILISYCIVFLLVILGGFYDSIGVFQIIWTIYAVLKLIYLVYHIGKPLPYSVFRLVTELIDLPLLYFGGFFQV